MRLVVQIAVAGFAAALVAAPVSAQRPDNQINPVSVELLEAGEAHLGAGRFVEADDALEAALVVDPRNRAAFIALAKVAQKQKLFGQAIRYTRKALALEPNDPDALAVQGEAMVELGAVAKARENLTKLQRLCPSGCPQLVQLTAAITRGPTAVAAVESRQAPQTN